LCDYFAEVEESYPTASKNRNWGEFTAELKVYFQ
jgi:hypothetical protein